MFVYAYAMDNDDAANPHYGAYVYDMDGLSDYTHKLPEYLYTSLGRVYVKYISYTDI